MNQFYPPSPSSVTHPASGGRERGKELSRTGGRAIGKVDGEGVYVGESPRGTRCEKAQPVTSQEIGRYSVLYQTYHTAAQAEPSHSHSIHQNFPTNNQGIALRNTLGMTPTDLPRPWRRTVSGWGRTRGTGFYREESLGGYQLTTRSGTWFGHTTTLPRSRQLGVSILRRLLWSTVERRSLSR